MASVLSLLSFTRSFVQPFRRIITSFVFAIALASPVTGQQEFDPTAPFGFRAGAIVSFGTHFQRLGVNLNFYYIYSSFQFNSEVRCYYNFRNLGPRKPYTELVLSQGVVYAYGKTQAIINPFINAVSNQSSQQNCIGYAYNAWFNRVGTKQQTGTIHIGVGAFSFITENDILAKPALDRFRSGAFLVQYRYKDLVEAGITCSIWTGQFKRKAEINGVPVFYNNCYMDSTGGTYTGFSHGLLGMQARMVLPFQQYVQVNAGIDAEQVRNALQNRLMHNMKFVPREINKARNCHLPMVDDKGGQYLYGPGQKVRGSKPYLNFSANPNIFY